MLSFSSERVQKLISLKEMETNLYKIFKIDFLIFVIFLPLTVEMNLPLNWQTVHFCLGGQNIQNQQGDQKRFLALDISKFLQIWAAIK